MKEKGEKLAMSGDNQIAGAMSTRNLEKIKVLKLVERFGLERRSHG